MSRLAELADAGALRERLAARGIREEESFAARGFAASALGLSAAGVSPDADAAAFFVPGRLEVLGKHTDYAGGRSLLAATSRGFALVAVPRGDQTIRMIDAQNDETASFPLSPEVIPTAGHWSNYAMTVARRLAQNFTAPLTGADIAFHSSLPRAAGMSSSSALVVATFLALSRINQLPQRGAFRNEIQNLDMLAGYLGTVENGLNFGSFRGDRGVGTFGGSEDHVAILCSRPGEVRQYSYCPVRLERSIAIPADHQFVLASSGLAAEKTGAAQEAYNRAALLAREAAAVWRQLSGRDDADLATAIGASPRAAEQIRASLASCHGGTFPAADLARRFEHFLAESHEIVPAAGDALEQGDLARFGTLVDRSQELTDTLLGNQVPETIFLAREARALGAVAASAFGAGFGGSVWALAPRDSAAALAESWQRSYAARYPQYEASATFFLSEAGPGAVEVSA